MKTTENFDKMIKTEKRKKLLKTIVVSLVTTIAVLLVGFAVIKQRMATQYQKAQEIANITDMIQSPNIISTSQYLSVTGRVTSQLRSERFKNINGYWLAVAPLEINFGFRHLGNGFSDINSPLMKPVSKTGEIGAFNRENGEKIPLFFNPKHQQKETELETKVTHEAKTLATLKNHVAEVAVTFEEPLTYEEIQKQIPDNLLINWYWIGIASNQLSVEDMLGKVIGLNADEKGKLNDDALSTKGPNSNAWYASNYPSFVAAVKRASETLGYGIKNVDIYQDALKQVKRYPTLKTAKFSGVIVSGRTENLAKLDDEPDVYATNVGLQTEILPYIDPTK